MSDDVQNQKNLVIFLALVCVILVAGFSAYVVINQSAQSNLQKALADAKRQVADVNQQMTQSKIAIAEDQAQQAREVAAAITQVDSPAARYVLVKNYYSSIASKLKPDSKQQLDSVIVYVEENPIVLVQLSQLPVQYSKIIQSLKSEIASATAKATSVATVKLSDEPSRQATASAQFGSTYSLVGTLSFVADDQVLGGSYFKLSDTNYGDPYVIYLSANNVPAAKELEDKKSSLKVTVTSQGDGFVTYDVLGGPTAAQ